MDIMQTVKHLSTGEKVGVALVAGVVAYFGWDWYKGKTASADTTKALPPPVAAQPGQPTPIMANAAPNGGPWFQVTTKDTGVAGDLNVRSGPGINFNPVAQLPKGSKVQASNTPIQQGTINSGGTSGDWALLLDPSGSGATLGWASMNYLTPIGVAVNPNPTAAASPADYLPASMLTPDMLQRMKDAGVQV